MKLKYKAKKHTRFNYGFMGLTTFTGNWWFHEDTKQWEDHSAPGYKSRSMGYSSHQDCNSMKAFRRKLKKCPKGIGFILVSRWTHNNIIGYGSNERT